jgi:hypothetical protein
LRRDNALEQFNGKKKDRGGWVFIVSALRGRNGNWSAARTEHKGVFEHYVRTCGIKKAIMTGENFRTKIFYLETGGHVLTLFLTRV